MSENKNSNRDKTFSGIFWKFGERIAAQLVSFVVTIVLGWFLMPEDYGLVAIVLIFITLADVFVSSGFGTALIQKKDADETDFSTIFYCSLAVSILMYVIMFFAAPYIAAFYEKPMLTIVLRVFSLRLPISSYNTVQHAYVSRHMIFKKFFFSTLGGTIISAGVGIGMAVMGFGVWALVAQYLVNTIIDSIVLTFTIPWRPKLVFSKSAAKGMVSYAWKILAADLIGAIFNQLRSLIIGKIYTSEDLAFYNRGSQIPGLISTNVSSSVMTVLFPAIANYDGDKLAVKNATRRATKVLAYTIFPMMVGCMVVARPLISTILPPVWEGSIIFMQLLSINTAVSVIGEVSLQTLKAIGRSDKLLKLELYKKPVYLGLLVAGACHSTVGIAVTMVIYSFYAVGINFRTMGRLIDYRVKEQFLDLFQVTSLSVVMGICAWLPALVIENNIILMIVQVIIGVGVYWGLSVVTKNDCYYYMKDMVLSKIKKSE